MTVTAPPELTEKLKRLEGEVALSLQERQRLERRAAELEQQLQAKLKADSGPPSRRREGSIRITIVDRLLFESGDAELKPVGCKVLKQFGEKLRQSTDKQIHVEGHTDNKLPKPKMRDRYPSNWELSTARANSVVRCLIKDGGVPPAMLSAVGYADSRPVADNDTEEGRRKNRRVEIILYPKTPTEEDVQATP
jgi:chemotaxis protein MotB